MKLTTGFKISRERCLRIMLAGFIAAFLLTLPMMADGQETPKDPPPDPNVSKPESAKRAATPNPEEGAPELTEEASTAIDKGLKYLLKTQKHKDWYYG